MQRHESSCSYCGESLIFVRFIQKKNGVRIYPKKGQFLVFCGNKKCRRK